MSNSGSFPPPQLVLEAPVSVTLATLCGGVTLLNVLRKREGVLLANLGIPLRSVVVTGAIPALVAELIVASIGAAVAIP